MAHDVYQVAVYLADCVKMGQERDRNFMMACEYSAFIQAENFFRIIVLWLGRKVASPSGRG